MLGYPRRRPPSRRSGPAIPLFDPSSDSACSFWVRSDSNVQIMSGTRQLVSGLTSRMPDQRAFSSASTAASWLRIMQASNGFDGLLTMGSFSAVGVSNSQRSTTTTFVLRFLQYRLNFEVIFCGIENAWALGSVGTWIRFAHPQYGWWPVIDSVIFPWNPEIVTVMTIRMCPVDEIGGDLRAQYRLTFNNTFLGPFTQGSDGGDRVIRPQDSLYVSSTAAGPTLFHEAIHFNRHLTDSEVSSMHTLLQQQYGQTP